MDIQILGFQNSNAISIVQLKTKEQDTFDYKSSSVAIRNGLIEVKEINESGSVNDLLVINYSDDYVFFMDGDILIGSKQNRVLNTSVLLSPKSKTILPVSCVEAGRWRYSSSKFGVEDISAPAFFRRTISKQVNDNLNYSNKHYANQGDVWKKVSELESLHKTASNTSNLSDIYHTKRTDLNSYIENFEINKSANGIAILINNNLSGIDIFNRKDIYFEYFSKILNGIAMESLYIKEINKNLEEDQLYKKVLDILKDFDSIDKKEYKGVGVGIEKRFDNQKFSGFELHYENNLIHLGLNMFKNKL